MGCSPLLNQSWFSLFIPFYSHCREYQSGALSLELSDSSFIDSSSHCSIQSIYFSPCSTLLVAIFDPKQEERILEFQQAFERFFLQEYAYSHHISLILLFFVSLIIFVTFCQPSSTCISEQFSKIQTKSSLLRKKYPSKYYLQHALHRFCLRLLEPHLPHLHIALNCYIWATLSPKREGSPLIWKRYLSFPQCLRPLRQSFGVGVCRLGIGSKQRIVYIELQRNCFACVLKTIDQFAWLTVISFLSLVLVLKDDIQDR